MMQQTLRPYVTTGIAVVGAGLIAVVPAAPHFPAVEHQLWYAEQREIRLTAGPDFFGPYVDLFTNTANNLQALGAHAFEFPILTQILSDPLGSLAHVPDVINLLTNPLPGLDISAVPLPLDLSAELPQWLMQILVGMGPLISVFNALQELSAQIFDFSDPLGALAALFGAPATLLNAFLNGQGSIDLMGFHLPLFNGILVQGQSTAMTFDLGQLVNMVGFGDTTLTDLLNMAGVGDQPLDSLLIGMLDAAGIGDLTVVGLLDQFGFADQSVVGLLTGLLESSGYGDQSISELLTELSGGPDTTVAGLLIDLLNSSGFGNPTITGLLVEFGMGDMTLGGLLKELLDAGGMGGATLPGLLDEFGMGDATLGSLLMSMLDPNSTITDLLNQMGDFGSMPLPALLGMALGDYGSQTLLDLLNGGFMGPDVSGSTTLTDLLNSLMPPGYSFEDLLNAGDNPYGEMTIGELVDSLPVGENTLGIDPTLSMGDIKFTQLLDIAGVGGKHLSELSDNSLIGLIKDPTLNSLMGNNTVSETLHNLGANAQFPDGLYGVTLNQTMEALGISTFTISDLLDQLGIASGSVTVEGFLTDLGFNPTLETLLTDLLGGMGLSNTSLNDLFSDWGLNNVAVGTVIDDLGLNNITLVSILNNLGLNNLDLDTIIDRMGLDGIQITTVLDNLGLGTVHLDSVISDLFGDLKVSTIMNDLGLDDTDLTTFVNSLFDSVFPGMTVGGLLTDLGLNNVDLDTAIGGLGLGDVTLNSLLADLGIATVDINALLDGMGLSHIDLLGVNLGDFFGWLPEMTIHLPQQIAEALGAV